jgi:hypothetical protein
MIGKLKRYGLAIIIIKRGEIFHFWNNFKLDSTNNLFLNYFSWSFLEIETNEAVND